jgi:uncharacterized protein YeaO (DUF488 family)
MNPIIKIKRVYEAPEKDDGHRVLIDRLWPRGIKKEAITDWEKELAPTTELRTWFDHQAERWPEFKKRYHAELKKNDYVNSFIKKHKTSKTITLLYASKDEEHSHVSVLRDYLLRLFEHLSTRK